LQKLYRFDGEELDGYEETVNMEVEEPEQISDFQERVLAELLRRRYGDEERHD